ncbi:MAG TPA: prephenate dehydrogenase [Pirellulales bacterium]|nr:prephenate dehydrogenase [Pirellulales bacterium]
MHALDTVAIVGVGLIGGSIGLALRKRGLATEIVGIGRRAESLRVAQERGAVTRATLDLDEGVADAGWVVVCTPVGRIADDVRAAAQSCRPGALITDAGSTKAEIVERVGLALPRGVRFIGSHPLAGSERSGAAAADADLFVDRLVVLTPEPTSLAGDVRMLSEFWTALGARVATMPAVEHDRLIAAASHLPHLVAAALAVATPDEALPLTATGWADSTRIASGDPELWRQIFASNRSSLLASLTRFEELLAGLRTALDAGDDQAVLEILRAAKQRRDGMAL